MRLQFHEMIEQMEHRPCDAGGETDRDSAAVLSASDPVAFERGEPGADQSHKKGRFYRPELDALRFFAFFSVFICHAVEMYRGRPYGIADVKWRGGELLTAGWTLRQHILAAVGQAGAFGLPLFFFLSSYLITELLLREREMTGRIHLKAFYVRRILRIWPLYYLGVALGIFNGLFSSHLQPLSTWHILEFVFFLAWIRPETIANEVMVLWSISVEEMFYLVWPNVAKLGGGRTIYRVSLFLIPIALITAALEPGNPWFNPAVQFLFFALGALFAIGLKGRAIHIPVTLRAALFLATPVVWCSVIELFLHPRQGFLGRAETSATYCLIALGCLFLFSSLLGLPSQYLPRPLVYLGRISYGLYVFHTFALETSLAFIKRFQLYAGAPNKAPQTFLLGLGLTIGAAAVSYRFFEKPFLKLKERFTFVRSRPVELSGFARATVPSRE